MHIQSPSIVRTVYLSIFKDIQIYSGKLMHIQPHSQARIQGEEGRLPLPFLKIECPDFRKKGPNCVHRWVKFSIQNVVLRVSRTKSTKMFPSRASFSAAFNRTFVEVPQFHLVVHLYSSIILFTKCCTLNVWQCLLSNLMLFTASGTFRILTYPAHCFFRYLLAYSRHTYAYSGIYSTLCNPPIFITLSYSEPQHIQNRRVI